MGDLVVEDFADGDRDDDAVLLAEEPGDFRLGLAAVVEAHEEPLLAPGAAHRGLEGVDVRASGFVLLLHLDREPALFEPEFVGPGKAFNFKDLSPEHKAAVLVGLKEGEKKVKAKAASIGKNINGWSVGSAFGNREFYSGGWLLRAGAAQAGIFGNDAVEAMYPMTRTTATGETLDTGKNNYTLTFPSGQLPPVNAFWSVTMYDGKSQLLIKNPIDRYLINSPMLSGMKVNADGSLTISIQKDSPGPDKESNWLPAPDGTVYLVMRLYWPKTAVPSILPPGEGTWKPPGIVKAN